jgi:hypothetical protein
MVEWLIGHRLSGSLNAGAESSPLATARPPLAIHKFNNSRVNCCFSSVQSILRPGSVQVLKQTHYQLPITNYQNGGSCEPVTDQTAPVVLLQHHHPYGQPAIFGRGAV